MQKVKDLNSLKKFSKLYKDYKILDFDAGNIKKEDLEKNVKLILSSLQHLLPIIEQFSDTTPTTHITTQVTTEGFVTDKEFERVQLNIKRWQELARSSGDSEQLSKILSTLTGFR